MNTGGEVVSFGDASGAYYVVEDDRALNMVQLRPTKTASHYAGARVSVSGRLGFAPGSGRYIEITKITAP